LQDPNLDFLFAYIQDADGAGHGTGFSLTSPAYINAIENNDAQVKAILKALKARPTYAQEEWLIVCSTDHGGLGFGHGGNSDQERHIWWFASAPFLQNKTLTGPDIGSYQMPSNPVDSTLLGQVPKQTDVAVTIIDHLLPGLDGDDVKSRWNLDGRSWLTPDNYDSTLYENQKGGIKGVSLNEQHADAAFSVYPNPVQSQIQLQSNGAFNGKISYELIDLNGRLSAAGELDLSPQAVIEVAHLENGFYLLRIRQGEALINRKIVIRH